MKMMTSAMHTNIFACLTVKDFQLWFDILFHIWLSVQHVYLCFLEIRGLCLIHVSTQSFPMKGNATSGCDSFDLDRAIAAYSQP